MLYKTARGEPLWNIHVHHDSVHGAFKRRPDYVCAQEHLQHYILLAKLMGNTNAVNILEHKSDQVSF